jgi:hypothetical protein
MDVERAHVHTASLLLITDDQSDHKDREHVLTTLKPSPDLVVWWAVTDFTSSPWFWSMELHKCIQG